MNENNPRIRKLKNDAQSHNIPCYFSTSVEKEIQEKVIATTNFLGTALKDTILIHLEDSRNKRGIPVEAPVNNEDIKALEELFNGFHSAIRTCGSLPHPLSFIEEWVISYLADNLDKGTSIGIADFVKELVKSVLKLTVAIQNSLDFLITFEKGFVKKKSVPFDSRISASIEKLGIHAPDSDHIASALANQCIASQKTVFVTLDFSSILSKRKVILLNHKIECCDPLYAMHHL
ncbi:MAG: hypothetical protein QXZ70_08565 [Candidatus Bathyarchaeia archaeon]